MKPLRNKRTWIGSTVVLGLTVILVMANLLVFHGAQAAGTAYYVDCSAASNGVGTQASPWNNLATPTARTFVAGDSILLKRGATCTGQLYPKGSGTAALPITIGDYGAGALPIINGGTTTMGIKLVNQQGWHIQNVEIVAGTKWGIQISNTGTTTLSHFRVTNVIIHDVSGEVINKDSGLLGIMTIWAKRGKMSDIIVDGVMAYNTHQWNGIHLACTGNETYAATLPAIVRNSLVHDTYGDGITIFGCTGGLIENTVAYNTGMIPTNTNGINTANSTWTYACKDCTVQFNEAYLAYSPWMDGGAFDVDWGSTNTYVQYNYGHDNESYCAAILGAGAMATTNSIVRYNICSNNDRDSLTTGGGSKMGEFALFTWDNGWLDGVAIYNNTTYWNPLDSGPVADVVATAFCNGCITGWAGALNGSLPRYFKNNIIYSTSPYLVYSLNNGMQLDNNIYWYTGAGQPYFLYGNTQSTMVTYRDLASYQAGSGQDTHSFYTDPLLNSPTYHGNGFPVSEFTLQNSSPAINAGANVGNMGSRDFFGVSIPQGGAYDIGAYESGGVLPTAAPTLTPTAGPSPTRTNTPGPTNTPTSTSVGCFGTTNIALNKTTTTSSVNAGDVGARAVDGNLTTRWWSLKNATPPQWIVVDLGSSQTVCKAIVKQDNVYATSYTIQVSQDNVNWTTVASTTNGQNVPVTHSFSAVAARYVMFNATVFSGNFNYTQLYELEFYQP